jgi:hypothetical protein
LNILRSNHYRGDDFLRRLLPLALILVILFLSTVLQMPGVKAATLLSDGFESGTLNSWTGIGGDDTKRCYPRAEVNSLYSHHGLAFAGAGVDPYYNGSDMVDVSSCYLYKTVTAPELYARGYFNSEPTFFPLDGDRSTFLAFMSSDGHDLAYAGWRNLGA